MTKHPIRKPVHSITTLLTHFIKQQNAMKYWIYITDENETIGSRKGPHKAWKLPFYILFILIGWYPYNQTVIRKIEPIQNQTQN